jgi:hypothetical protein
MVNAGRRWVGLARALVALFVVLAVTACGVGLGTGDDQGTARPRPSDKPLAPVDPPVEVIGLPDDVELEVPESLPGSENGENLAFVSPVYTLMPAGALGSPVTVRLRLDNAQPPNSRMLVASRTAADQPWTYVPAVLTPDQRHVDFEATSLDQVGALAVDVEGARAGFQQDLGAALTTGIFRAAKKPTCAGEEEAREQGHTVAASKTKTLFWCFGLEDGKRVVRVTNRRPIPVEVAHPDVPVLSNPEPARAWAAWSRALGTGKTLLAPGRTATYEAELEPKTELTLDAESLALGQSMRLLQAGVTALTLRLAKFGTAPANVPKTVSTFLAMPQCAKALGKGSDAMVTGCFSGAKLTRVFGSRARLVAPLIADPAITLFLRRQASDIGLRAKTTERQRILVRRAAPDFRGFTALWSGPRRLLSIDAEGQVTELVTDETGAAIIKLSYQLEDPEREADVASAKATITAVKVSRPKLVSGRVPRVGDAGTLRVRKGVVTPPFLKTTYCTPAAAKRGSCAT